MAQKKDFQTFFAQGFQKELLEQENCRKKAVNQRIYSVGLWFIAVALGIFLFKINSYLSIALGVLLFGFGVFLMVKSIDFELKLKAYFKETLMPEMIKNLGEGLRYIPKGGVHRSKFVASKIFKSSIDVYEAEDLVVGFVGQTEIEFSELNVQYITRDNKGGETKHTVFKGIFFIADFHKDFKGETFVLRDQAQRIFGSIGTFFQRINGIRPELVLMENPIFEKQFVVYSTDQIESRYIITPRLMESMVEMNRKFNGIQFSFVQSKMYVAVPISENLFEPRLFKSFNDTRYIEGYFNVLSQCIRIVDALHLNERIWSKA